MRVDSGINQSSGSAWLWSGCRDCTIVVLVHLTAVDAFGALVAGHLGDGSLQQQPCHVIWHPLATVENVF